VRLSFYTAVQQVNFPVGATRPQVLYVASNHLAIESIPVIFAGQLAPPPPAPPVALSGPQQQLMSSYIAGRCLIDTISCNRSNPKEFTDGGTADALSISTLYDLLTSEKSFAN